MEYMTEQLEKMVRSDKWFERHKAAVQGYGLDVLVNDVDEDVREAVAQQGYGLDRLIFDKSSHVRQAVANQGFGLDILIKDEVWWVRLAVAEQGYGLDVLVNDLDVHVRELARAKMEELKEKTLVERLDSAYERAGCVGACDGLSKDEIGKD